jgi:hypothetical protein
LQADLLQMRKDRETGELIPRAATIAVVESLGRAVQRANQSIVGWAEEVLGAGQAGGLPQTAAMLRAKSVELGASDQSVGRGFDSRNLHQ